MKSPCVWLTSNIRCSLQMNSDFRLNLRIWIISIPFRNFASALFLGLMCVDPASADERADALFENSIRPVLVETCFRCHGDTKISGGLRVDSREALLLGGESGASIVLGKPEDSLLVKAVKRHADVSAMPPDKDKALRLEQIAAFEDWIRGKAHWPKLTKKFENKTHWAYEPLRAPEPPTVRIGQPEGSRTEDRLAYVNPIDAFIRAKQKERNFVHAPATDKVTLIRRATFDLTGLPPTPSEVAAFEMDSSPTAFMKLIDRLLESSDYGRRWGRHWLDVVRYADTAGETADYPVPLAWRYRNYVIDAFNADKPYDQFLREQIAGDVLANQGPAERYAEQVIATGYLAISRRFGFDSENYHHLTIQDTIDTLGQSVLGLSLGCARCHDHKFDDISMNDYYGLYAIFDSSRYAFPGSEQKQKFRSLAPLIPPSEAIPKWRAFDQRVASIASKLVNAKLPVPAAILRSLNDIDGDFEMQAPANGGSNGVLVPPWLYEGKIAVTNAAQSPFKNLYAGGKVGASIGADIGEYRISQALYPRRTSKDCRALHVNLDFRVPAVDAKAHGVHRFWLGSMSASKAVVVSISADSVSLQIDDIVERISHVKPNEWHNLQLNLSLAERTVSGSVGTLTNEATFANKPLISGWSGTVDLVVLESSKSDPSGLPAIEFDNLGIQEEPIPSPLTGPANIASASESLVGHEQELVSAIDSDAKKASQELTSMLVGGPFEMAYGMAEGTPHSVSIQLRGEPSQPGALVARGFVKVLGGDSLPNNVVGSGRLELAHWLTRPDNPLTARVMVNRIWQYHFGQGLVKTSNDFGVRGLPPTHPELLDYLATQFIASGWSVKDIHRLIMRSETYQQSSRQADSQSNDLLTHFSRRRLSAEEIRDSILMVSGELNCEPTLEHPFPSPISFGFTQHSPFIAVYENNNRSVYLMTQRLKRHPFLALFDGPDPNSTTPDRLETTVPTQALFFLNDPFVHAKSGAWAKRLRASEATETQQIELAYQSAFSRSSTDLELSDAAMFLAAYRTELTALGQDNIENCALAGLLRTLFGSNEFLHVD